MTRLALTTTLGLTVAVAAATTHADSITTATFEGTSSSHKVTIHAENADGQVLADSTVRAGVYNFANASGALTGDFDTFCIEMQTIRTGDTPSYQHIDLESAPGPDGPGVASGPMSAAAADNLRELWGRHHDQAVDTSLSDSQQRTNAAAFQVAVWELVYDDDSDLSDTQGSFYLTDAPTDVTNQASSWLGSIDGTGAMALGLEALHSDDYQDQLVNMGSATPVPSPTAAAGALPLLGLLAIGLSRRRRIA